MSKYQFKQDGEKSWRVYDGKGNPLHHSSFLTKEDAQAQFPEKAEKGRILTKAEAAIVKEIKSTVEDAAKLFKQYDREENFERMGYYTGVRDGLQRLRYLIENGKLS